MDPKEKFILSIDIGTTAIKVGLFSADGKLVQKAMREQQLEFLGGGYVEQSPLKTWDGILEASRQVLQGYPPSTVSAIALATQRGTTIPLDWEGQPLSDFIVWMDERGIPFIRQIETKVGAEKYYETCGHPIQHITGITKGLWIHEHAQDKFPQLATIAPPETLFLRWLGCEQTVCSHSTGTYLFPFDIKSKIWSEDIAEVLGFPVERLPKLVSSVEVVGTLSEQAAAGLGLRPGIPLVPGGGDGQCAATGCGVILPGLGMINIGTGAGVQTYLPEPVKDPTQILNCAAHVAPHGWEMEGHTQASGAVLRWWRDEFGATELAIQKASHLDAYDLLIEQARLAPPGSDGLVFLPLFNGSTAPRVDLHARGVFLGLALTHGRSHLIRALLEGISLEIRWMLDTIGTAGIDIRELRLVGGGSRNPFWNQIHADIFNRPVSTLENPEATLTGAAMCAAVAIGLYQDLNQAAQNFVKIKETIRPDLNHMSVYETAYQNYRDAYVLLSGSGIFEQMKKQTYTP